jgi:membrane associated rhomboid family serine protease
MSVVPSFYFVRLARVPAAVFIWFWFILQLLYIGGMIAVAYVAHIGGLLKGLLVTVLFRFTRRR